MNITPARHYTHRGQVLTRFFLTACASFLAGPVMAQVGTPPSQSPFRDLETKMEFSILGGYFNAGKDPVGVASHSGPYAGARYEYRLGNLISLAGRLAVVPTTRTVIDPSLPAATRAIGETDQTVFLIDAGLVFNITGARSFHNLVPVIALGAGLASDFQAPDAGGYALRRFMFTAGLGVKWLAGESFQLRLDATDYIIPIAYPDRYFIPASDGTAAREGDTSVYTGSIALTLGLSYRFFR